MSGRFNQPAAVMLTSSKHRVSSSLCKSRSNTPAAARIQCRLIERLWLLTFSTFWLFQHHRPQPTASHSGALNIVPTPPTLQCERNLFVLRAHDLDLDRQAFMSDKTQQLASLHAANDTSLQLNDPGNDELDLELTQSYTLPQQLDEPDLFNKTRYQALIDDFVYQWGQTANIAQLRKQDLHCSEIINNLTDGTLPDNAKYVKPVVCSLLLYIEKIRKIQRIRNIAKSRCGKVKLW